MFFFLFQLCQWDLNICCDLFLLKFNDFMRDNGWFFFYILYIGKIIDYIILNFLFNFIFEFYLCNIVFVFNTLQQLDTPQANISDVQ